MVLKWPQPIVTEKKRASYGGGSGQPQYQALGQSTGRAHWQMQRVITLVMTDFCEKLVKDASELLQSEMDDLVAAVDSGEKAITTAWKRDASRCQGGKEVAVCETNPRALPIRD